MNPNDTETRLSLRQLRALEVLSTGGRIRAAAAAAGVSLTTVKRWLRESAFAAELRRMEGELLRVLGRRLLGLGDDAARALEDALRPETAMSQRLRAADLVTSRGPQLAELTQLVERLEVLEKRLEGHDAEERTRTAQPA